jgi:HAMP domain-containing protein
MATEINASRIDELERHVVEFSTLADQLSPEHLDEAATEFEAMAATYNRLTRSLRNRAAGKRRAAERFSA